MEYKIIEFEPKEAPDEFWEGYCEFTESNQKEMNPDDPLADREGIIQRQKADFPDFTVKRWLAETTEEKIIGWAGFGVSQETSSDYEENKHIASINIVVLKDFRRKGIGTALLKKAVEQVQNFDRTIIEVGSDHDAGRAFLKHYGAQMTIEGAENRLEMSDVDWDMMQTWIEEGPKRAPDVKIETFLDVCPEEILEEYAEMYTEAMNMQPLGEIESRANIDGAARRKQEKRTKEVGQTNYTMITREKDGRISGLTEIYYDSREGHRMFQGLTGVRPEFRGRGLGKWLKGLMIVHVKENYPEVEKIITGNAESNEAMLSINERMGFKKYKGGEAYKFKTEDLVKRFNL
ncbi:MAG: GNAT family N-acetyltransferase [Candidatus Heimdallarchaeota archaeon]|nr:GNAT family N-acetyltransferase [Candidatus Heimdallarchaeota archaeon]MCK4877339.1 GNAT family N-acetyltransferase [Candidatus Heimdallarchaeota archaeon]